MTRLSCRMPSAVTLAICLFAFLVVSECMNDVLAAPQADQGAGTQKSSAEAAKKGAPVIVLSDQDEINKMFKDYKSKTGNLPKAQRKGKCENYSPDECIILLGRPCPFGCAICCLEPCTLPTPGPPAE